MKRRLRVLMVKVGTATFIERDERILTEQCDLKVFRLGSRSWAFVWSAIRFVGWVLRHGLWADVFFTRFAQYNGLLLVLAGKLLRRKTAVVLGGSDSIWIPRYHYGVHDHWLRRRTTRWTLHHADLLLPVHGSLLRGVNTYSDESPRDEGILVYHPDITTRTTVVHNGFDPAFWTPDERMTRDNVVLTVAIAEDWTVFMTKGLNYFLDTAARLPQYRFVLVGTRRDAADRWYHEPIGANVEFLPPLPATDLRTLYRSAKVFAHFTLTEGMPNVLCEAMLCGCVPVGSTVNSLPDIIGDTGILIAKRDVAEMTRGIETAMRRTDGLRARARIVEQYPLARRARELTAALESLRTN